MPTVLMILLQLYLVCERKKQYSDIRNDVLNCERVVTNACDGDVCRDVVTTECHIDKAKGGEPIYETKVRIPQN